VSELRRNAARLSFEANQGRITLPRPRPVRRLLHFAKQASGAFQTRNCEKKPAGGDGPTMSDDSALLQGLLDRMKNGDRAARRELLDRACTRLRRLANTMLAGSFPALREQHELDSVVHETWLRLLQALDQVEPPTVADFFRLAAHKVRQVLLDMADRQRRRAAREVPGLGADSDSDSAGPASAGGQTLDPARLALWSEFHARVANLPEDERKVFELHYYLELPQAEIARMLNLHPRKVSYLWVADTERLADELEGVEGFL
jgi:RNA polymerase sigma factor (sigma-70 family)